MKIKTIKKTKANFRKIKLKKYKKIKITTKIKKNRVIKSLKK